MSLRCLSASGISTHIHACHAFCWPETAADRHAKSAQSGTYEVFKCAVRMSNEANTPMRDIVSIDGTKKVGH